MQKIDNKDKTKAGVNILLYGCRLDVTQRLFPLIVIAVFMSSLLGLDRPKVHTALHESQPRVLKS